MSITFDELFFFFNNPAPTEIYTLSLHDPLPISSPTFSNITSSQAPVTGGVVPMKVALTGPPCSTCSPGISCPRRRVNRSRSEEHTSELQSHSDLVCRLLLEKKNMGM